MTDKDIIELKTLFYQQQATIDRLEKTIGAAVEIMINQKKEKPVVKPESEQWLTPEEVCNLTKYDYDYIRKMKKEWKLIWRQGGKKLLFRADKIYEFMKSHNINAL